MQPERIRDQYENHLNENTGKSLLVLTALRSYVSCRYGRWDREDFKARRIGGRISIVFGVG